jgi:hypothetical protein
MGGCSHRVLIAMHIFPYCRNPDTQVELCCVQRRLRGDSKLTAAIPLSALIQARGIRPV